MPRGLDHIVHAVRDLDQAAALYQRLGFTVGGRNRHPWGTHNHIIQFPGFFIELLTVAEPQSIVSPEGRMFSFGHFNQDFLARREGLSMLALESGDAEADAEAFQKAGIGEYDVFKFSREGRRPDGESVTLAFSLAFAHDPMAPETGFFTCQNHYPENFWSPAFQAHPNSTNGVLGAVLVAENPTDHHIFLSALVGERELLATSTGITIPTPRGDTQVMNPEAFRVHYGVEPPDTSGGARLAALRLRVDDFSRALGTLKNGGLDGQVRMGRIVVGPHTVKGATLILEVG